MKKPVGPKFNKALEIVKTLHDKGYEAYFVGGCVRDMVMEIEPLDYDIATNAVPEEVEQIFLKTVTVGAQFGVVKVIENAGEFEIAAFRSDVSYADGRHPTSVAFATKEEDVTRRDFTINGMLYEPFSDTLIDLVGGGEDLKARIIRAIGEPRERFTEDALRLMRAIRFSARLNFPIEKKTWQAVLETANLITKVSSERVFDELTRMLTEGKARHSFELLEASGLLKILLPEVAGMKGVQQPPEFHPEGDVWQHTLLMLGDLEKSCDSQLAWAVLLHDVGKPKTITFAERIRFDGHDKVGAEIAQTILERLKASNKLISNVTTVIADHLKFINVEKMRPSRLKRFLWSETFPLQMQLHYLDCLHSHGNLSAYRFCESKLTEFAAERERMGLRPLLNGDDLQGMGFAPGPLFKDILSKLIDAQLDGDVKNRDEAIEWIKKNFQMKEE